MRNLRTVGYEGQNIEEFIEFLSSKKIQLLIDVRRNPVSRKKGFSKNKLAGHLKTLNIDYLHLKSLGVPSDWRKRAKNKLITREKMFADYVKIILPEQTELLEQILDLTKHQLVALLCYEAEASDCHRRFIAEALMKRQKKLKVIDLKPPNIKGLYRGSIRFPS